MASTTSVISNIKLIRSNAPIVELICSSALCSINTYPIYGIPFFQRIQIQKPELILTTKFRKTDLVLLSLISSIWMMLYFILRIMFLFNQRLDFNQYHHIDLINDLISGCLPLFWADSLSSS